jgi:membrane-bound serine protease (ClpP class)
VSTDILWVVAILLSGLLLLGVEIFVLPGFGVAGILGIAVVLGGSALAWMELGPVWGLLSGVISLGVAGVAFYLLPRTRAGKRLVLESSQAGSAPDPHYRELVGRSGVAITPLRPSGTLDLAGARYDVVTDGSYVEAGTAVTVVSVEGVRIVVEPVAEPMEEPQRS